MMADINRQVLLAARPDGIPQAVHFPLAEAPGAISRLYAGENRGKLVIRL